ncbi:MAG: hypothetical protein ACOZAA_05850 [Pseudomonadota bacterium]
MTLQLHAPSFPFDSAGDFSNARQLAGHLAATAFVITIALLCAKIVMFTPAPDAKCLPEICGPAEAE